MNLDMDKYIEQAWNNGNISENFIDDLMHIGDKDDDIEKFFELCGTKKDTAVHTPGVAAMETPPQTCTVCGSEKTESIEKLFVPAIIEGNGAKWSGKGTLTFKSNADVADFIGVTIDGDEADSTNYTVTKDSTVITLEDEYPKTLDWGEHTTSIKSKIGEPTANYAIFYIIN